MIKSVIRANNGMVAVFDENDEPIREYLGEYEKVKEKILRDAPPYALFSHVTATIEVVPREEW